MSKKYTMQINDMHQIPNQEKVLSFLIMGAATIIILAGLTFASRIVGPVMLSLFLTIILVVPIRWLQKKGCPKIIALIIVLGLMVTFFVIIGSFIGRSLNDFMHEIPTRTEIIQKFDAIEEKIAEYGFTFREKPAQEKNKGDKTVDSTEVTEETHKRTDTVTPSTATEGEVAQKTNNIVPPKTINETVSPLTLNASLPSTNDPNLAEQDSVLTTSNNMLPSDENKVNENNTTIEKPTVSFGDKTEKSLQGAAEETLDPASSPILLTADWVRKVALELKQLVEGSLLVMIITFFMIFEAARFPEKVDLAFGKKGPINSEHFHHIANEIRRYLFLKAISSLMSATAAMTVYFAFGVPGALFWGFVAFFLYFIPNIGGTIAAIIPGILIFVASDVGVVLLYIVCLVAIECTIGYGIEPKMLGHGLGISTVVILLSLIFWGWILGPIGLFLAAPLTIMVKIILQAFKETEWIAIMIDDSPKKHLPLQSE